ncbi:MAG TPA: 2-C-methyl-D-erythritol 4-phosphate cytidylyltransferase [Candidatus Mediterraneibacter merdipullorum]|nr:2-C-methyl-D-erythritol 4-phosphate cytidylyltransferase [Candidatus Mediterraneibacter merdipullorum]
MEKTYCTAVVLAAGSGKRMGTKVHKQYLLMGGKPVLYYSLNTFQESPLIDEIILVCGSGEEEYCRCEIVEKYGFEKVSAIIPGGAQRYDSVWNGLQKTKDGYVYIHDGARPFVDGEMLARAYRCVSECHACVAGMPSKDTVKIADEDNTVQQTPDRSRVWLVQTPQVFDTDLIRRAYARLMEQDEIAVTDDAMVAEQMLGCRVKLFSGSYENIKITTPEDLAVAEVFLQRKS